MKACSKCGVFKDVDAFHKSSKARDGLQSQCKDCAANSTKEWQRSNPNKSRTMATNWKQNNSERVKEYYSKWSKENPEKVVAKQHRRRALKHNNGGTHTGQDIINLYIAQGGCCHYCGKDISNGYHVEHKQPLSRGGSNGPENLALACPKCNLLKGNRTDVEFINGWSS